MRVLKRKTGKGKRSAEEYTTVYSVDDNSLESLEKLINFCEKDEKVMLDEVLKEFKLKHDFKENSWLAPIMAKKNQKLS